MNRLLTVLNTTPQVDSRSFKHLDSRFETTELASCLGNHVYDNPKTSYLCTNIQIGSYMSQISALYQNLYRIGTNIHYIFGSVSETCFSGKLLQDTDTSNIESI
jgi:hypothetical protein